METNSISILHIGKDKINFKAKELFSILTEIGDRPLGIVSINGPKRTGKSFVLNYFLKYLSSSSENKEDWFDFKLETQFKWRGGSERETVGINVFNKPFFITDDSGREIAILLMDTQGNFDDETTMQQNAMVFTISTLLSSILIFNVRADIGEDILQFLQLFSGYAQMISREPSRDEGNDEYESLKNEEVFQKLIFLVRDFQFSEYEYGYYDDFQQPEKQPIERNLKVDKLNPRGNQPAEVKYTRQKILNSFGKIGVYAMPDPGKELKRKDDDKNLDEDFRIYLKKFVEMIFNSGQIATKKIGGIEITGNSLKKYLAIWSTHFYSGNIPQVDNIFTSVSEIQNSMAKRTSVSFYSDQMKLLFAQNNIGYDTSELGQMHFDLMNQAINMFKNMRKLGGVEVEHKYLFEVMKEIEEIFGFYQSLNQNRLYFYKRNEESRKIEEELKERIELAQQILLETEKRSNEEIIALKLEVDRGLKTDEELQEKELENQELLDTITDMTKVTQMQAEVMKSEMHEMKNYYQKAKNVLETRLEEMKLEQMEKELKFQIDTRKQIEREKKFKKEAKEQVEREKQIKEQAEEEALNNKEMQNVITILQMENANQKREHSELLEEMKQKIMEQKKSSFKDKLPGCIIS